MSEERWLPINGFEGVYEVSDLGRVRSLDRVLVSRDGVRRFWPGCLRALALGTNGYSDDEPDAAEGNESRSVHTLVMRSFVGPPPDGMEVCH